MLDSDDFDFLERKFEQKYEVRVQQQLGQSGHFCCGHQVMQLERRSCSGGVMVGGCEQNEGYRFKRVVVFLYSGCNEDIRKRHGNGQRRVCN